MPTRTRFLEGCIFLSLKTTHHFVASHLCMIPTSIENNGDEQQQHVFSIIDLAKWAPRITKI